MATVNPGTKIGSTNVRGKEFDVYVDDSGHFRSPIGLEYEDGVPKYIFADSMESLRKRIMAETRSKSVKVEIKYLSYENDLHWTEIVDGSRVERKGPTFSRGVATGIHGGTNNVTITSDCNYTRKQEPDQDKHYGRAVFNVLTPSETLEGYIALKKQKAAIEKSLVEIEGRWTFNLRNAVVIAMKAGDVEDAEDVPAVAK